MSGRSLKITKPIRVANGSSRYCIGASVAAGASRSDQVINRCATVPSTPMAPSSQISRPSSETNPSPGTSALEKASQALPRMAVAMRPLTACRLIGSVALAMLRVTIMNSAKATATPKRQQCGSADGGIIRLDHQQGAGEPDDASHQPVGPDFLAQHETAEQQHQERHYEGDGDGVCQRQEAEGGKHRRDAENMQDGAQHREMQQPHGHAQAASHQPHDRDQQRGLQGEADQQQLAERYRLAEDLGEGIAERSENAETGHEQHAAQGACPGSWSQTRPGGRPREASRLYRVAMYRQNCRVRLPPLLTHPTRHCKKY